MISWKGNLVPSLSTIVSLSVLNNVELCYRGTGTSWSRGGSVIAAFFLAHNYVSEQFGNYVEYGIYYMVSVKAKIRTISSDVHQLQFIKLHHFKLEIFKSI